MKGGGLLRLWRHHLEAPTLLTKGLLREVPNCRVYLKRLHRTADGSHVTLPYALKKAHLCWPLWRDDPRENILGCGTANEEHQ